MPLPEFETPSRAPRWAGAAAVVGLHLLAGWALMSGLARQTVETVRQTVEMAIIDAPAPPPPPPPPRLKETPPPPAPVPKTPPPPAVAPPPPAPKAWAPQPEIAPPPAPAAAPVQAVQPELPRSAPPAPPAPAAPAPVVAPAPAAPVAPVRAEVGLACPGHAQIIQDAMAGAFDRYGVTGVVRVRMLVRGGQVVEVSVLSGPREYHRLAVSAARRMKCQASGADEVQVNFEISLREE
ncbi:MAG: hypothetical protein RL654_3418 [Pseudomonadota bacterium]|jgi:protein TonB